MNYDNSGLNVFEKIRWLACNVNEGDLLNYWGDVTLESFKRKKNNKNLTLDKKTILDWSWEPKGFGVGHPKNSLGLL